jgi:hypothetical protein
MLLKRNNTDASGDFFAIWPRWTPDGWRAFERLHWEYVEGWGWGSGGYYEYSRPVPEDPDPYRTIRGLYPISRAVPPRADLPAMTNPDPYRAYLDDWPGPCSYPHCTCMEEHGSNCPGGPP